MKIVETELADLKIVESSPQSDDRGAFMRLYCTSELGDVLGTRRIAQINHSRTTQVGAVRGMHFQRPPHAEMKLIRCLRGRVWDVAVDIRADSPTFLQWHAEELVGNDGQMIVIPEGFAHGFQVLEPDSELLYLHTAAYHPAAEGGPLHDDPRVGISWPLHPLGLSSRDLNHPALDNAFTGVVL
jgi:dTDP-4-dehydrorhamnose 3,5-epimerase